MSLTTTMRLGFTLLLLLPLTLYAAKVPVPVEVELIFPQTVSAGEPFYATLRLQATQPLQQLEIHLSPWRNLEVRSHPLSYQLKNMEAGEWREWLIELRQIYPEPSYLNLEIVTINAFAQRRGASRMFLIGEKSAAQIEQQRYKQQQQPRPRDINGRPLLIMRSE
ncbi:MAG: hypothetical protein HQL49_04455 [Gammaproteobacteria bacterium]|nr:hypothetical protein [Gammaproteobacteria bacterium]